MPVRFHADPAQFDRTGDPLTPAKLNDRARSWVYEVSGKIVLSNDAGKLRVPYQRSSAPPPHTKPPCRG
ncbi:MAG: hypothetical protein CM1200mP34_2780 [Verrucomicrobiales bacterium]|nr:MAG: hypothetical protein CM1200mP34_2780 [Verrucomicrobiales bacterium]